MHKPIHLLLLLLGVALLTGCSSTLYMASTKNLQRFDGGTRAVYVTNPEMRPEYQILKASAIYQLTDQPEAAAHLTLHPIRHFARCGNPLMLSMFTFGIVPGVLPGARVFEYDLETDGVSEQCLHHLPVYERFSLWERLVIRSERKVMAEALAWSACQRQKPEPASR